jgi:uncharacterized protein YegP (UPF0339 family)
MFEVYQDDAGEFRWRFRNPHNGKLQASSGEAFASRANAERAVNDFLDEIMAHPKSALIKETIGGFEVTGGFDDEITGGAI